MSDGKGAASAAPAIPASPTPVQVERTCDAIETWAQKCADISTIKETADKLAAIDEYLARTSTEGRARVAAAQRRLEVRIGQLLSPASKGGREKRSVATEGLSRHERSEFRAMAEDSDTVEEVIATSTDEKPPSRRKVVSGIKAKATTKKTTARPKPPPKVSLDDGRGGPTYDPEVIDWLWLRFERGMSAAEICAATRSGDYGWPLDRWPKGMSEGSVLACRATIYHMQRFEAMHPMKRRPRYSGKRLREIAARSKPLQPIDKVQRTVTQMTAALEGVDIEDYDLDGSYAQMIILDLYEDLGEHQGWIDKTVMAIRRHLDQAEVIEKIRKLREDTTGRTPAEIEAFRAAADRLERLKVWGEIG